MKFKIGTPGYISYWIGEKAKDITKYEALDILCKNLVPTPGRDWMHFQLYTNTIAASASKGANHIGVSETSVAPDDTWTETDFRTTFGELASGNMGRAAASPAPSHIAGTNVSLIEKTFSPSANFPNTQVVGLLTAASGSGVLVHVGRFDTIANVQSGQSFRVLCTINHG